jgi:hypothetical protein
MQDFGGAEPNSEQPLRGRQGARLLLRQGYGETQPVSAILSKGKRQALKVAAAPCLPLRSSVVMYLDL